MTTLFVKGVDALLLHIEVIIAIAKAPQSVTPCWYHMDALFSENIALTILLPAYQRQCHIHSKAVGSGKAGKALIFSSLANTK